MGARVLSSTGLGSGNLIGRAQFPPAPALDKNRSPIHNKNCLQNHKDSNHCDSSCDFYSFSSQPWRQFGRNFPGALQSQIGNFRRQKNYEYSTEGQKCHPGRNYINPPPLPPFLAKRQFSGEGGGGVYFEAPRGRNFIPPPLYTPHA